MLMITITSLCNKQMLAATSLLPSYGRNLQMFVDKMASDNLVSLARHEQDIKEEKITSHLQFQVLLSGWLPPLVWMQASQLPTSS